MSYTENTDYSIIKILNENEKEKNCLLLVDEILNNKNISSEEILANLVQVIPYGWKYPEKCHVKIIFEDQVFPEIQSEIKYWISSDIWINNRIAGKIIVFYSHEINDCKKEKFTDNEKNLLKIIADRIGQTLFFRQMQMVIQKCEVLTQSSSSNDNNKFDKGWLFIINYLKETDPSILLHICRKMTNFLLLNGIKKASEIVNNSVYFDLSEYSNLNYPVLKKPIDDIFMISQKIFELASEHFPGDIITLNLKKWLQEENIYFLLKVIGSINSSLRDIIESLNRYYINYGDNENLHSSTMSWIRTTLITRFFSDKTDFINIAKNYISVSDFQEVINRIIFPTGSNGRLGGKSTGLFLAKKILEKEQQNIPSLSNIKVPKTWYITADALTDFLHYNNLEELNDQKYKDLSEIRIDYPNIIYLMKNAKLPPEIIKGLLTALDEFGDCPIIVRSSSLLEDQMGAVFSGKYKSLFLANQGTKLEKLEALVDAIIEVYASVFSPDSMQYRAEHGLTDANEEMGILIQEVVGNKIGKYFFPLYSGVAFSKNEFRWSTRIKREDGLVRIVPGLGTRAVDRLTDDFPVLISPGQPNLKVNIVAEEIKRYSPKKIDVIDLEKNSFETVDIKDLLKEIGENIPNVNLLLSFLEGDHIINKSFYEIDFENTSNIVVDFNGILSQTDFIKKIRAILKVLEEKLSAAIDIEFASDGKHFYLLQCRPQSHSKENTPAPIPKNLSMEDIIFTASKYISNGLVENIAYVVYVDPLAYSKISKLEEMIQVGRIIGELNRVLPKKQFILLGPGRWGSRGDIKLGVQVSYSDINNTAALIEIAFKNSIYTPELSFGTHFFQDLVEANIRYLPLYPDENNSVFNTDFLKNTKNELSIIFPQYEAFSQTVYVTNIPVVSNGKFLKLAMNAEENIAIGYLSPP